MTEQTLSVIHSGTDTYSVESFLGRGSFGTVAKCRRRSDSRTVALKIIKKKPTNNWEAQAEITVLEKLKKLDPDMCNWVRWHQAFDDASNSYLEFECLDQSLMDFMKGRQFKPLDLDDIRPILRQTASALFHLKALGIVHGDLKPENMMLVDQTGQPYRVKVIDFGLAHKVSDARRGAVIQTLQYRAPEILLGLPYNTSVDVWSLGCIAAFLYQGHLLYPGKNPYEMLKYIVQTQGQPADTVLDGGLDTAHYFVKDTCSNSWRLKTDEEFYQEKARQFRRNRKGVVASLDDLLHLRDLNTGTDTDPQANMDKLSDVHMFVDLLKGMLHLDPKQRLTPHEVVRHPFLSMSHLSTEPHSSYATSSLNKMKVCPHVLKIKKPVKKEANTCRDSGAPVKHDPTSLRPSISSHSQTNGKHDSASHQGERAKEEQLSHQRKTSAAQSSSRSSQPGTTSTFHQGAELSSTLSRKRKSPDDLGPGPDRKRQHVSSRQTEDFDSHKRKRSADQWTPRRSQPGASSTFYQGAELKSTLSRKRKSPDDFGPGLDRKRQRVSLQPPTSSEDLTSMCQRKRTPDIDSHERKCSADQWTPRSSQPGARSSFHQVAELSSTLSRKRKSPDDFGPGLDRKRQRVSLQPPTSSEELTSMCQRKSTPDTDSHERKCSADQWTPRSSQPGASSTFHQVAELKLTLSRKRKSPDDFGPGLDRKRQHISLQPPTSSEDLTSMCQRKSTPDTDSHERKCSADQWTCRRSQPGAGSTFHQGAELKLTLSRKRKSPDD